MPSTQCGRATRPEWVDAREAAARSSTRAARACCRDATGSITFTADQLDQAEQYSAARTRILTGVHLGAEERAALERIVFHAAIVVDHARALTGMDHHGDLADKIGELIAAAGQAEQRRAGS